jgi:hypothetical protein
MRGRVCKLLYNCFWALPEQSLLGRSPAELTALFCCLNWDSIQFRLGPARTVTLRSKSRRTHGLILLSHLRLHQPGGPGRWKRPCIYIVYTELQIDHVITNELGKPNDGGGGYNWATLFLGKRIQEPGSPDCGSLKFGTVKYGHESWERLWWGGPAATVKYRSILSSERAILINKPVTV